jgi:enoyl-CoA hydratase
MCVFADRPIVADNVRISGPAVPIGGGFIARTWVAEVGVKRAKEFAFLPGNGTGPRRSNGVGPIIEHRLTG